MTEFSWLTGAWEGEGLGGEVEEMWSAPVGGTMVGHFRLVRDGKPVFYELLTLIEVEGSVEGAGPVPGMQASLTCDAESFDRVVNIIWQTYPAGGV